MAVREFVRRRDALRRREALYESGKANWPRPYPREADFTVARWSRGFVLAIEIDPGSWLAHGDDPLAQHPIETVYLSDRPGYDAGDTSFRLLGDPKGEAGAVAFDEALAEQQPDDGDDLLPAVLRCRWRGIRFEFLPDDTAEDLERELNRIDAVAEAGDEDPSAPA